MKKPTLFILCGLPFAGKTTLSIELAKRFAVSRVNLDEIKWAHGYTNTSDDDVPDEEWTAIYNETYDQTKKLLKDGKSVLCDFSNLEKSERDALRNVAKDAQANSMVIFINIPPDEALNRWRKNKESNERFDLPEKIMNEAIHDLEIPTEDENVYILDWQKSPEDWVQIFKKLLP